MYNGLGAWYDFLTPATESATSIIRAVREPTSSGGLVYRPPSQQADYDYGYEEPYGPFEAQQPSMLPWLLAGGAVLFLAMKRR